MQELTSEGKQALLVGLQLCRMHAVPLKSYVRLFHFIAQAPAPTAPEVADEVDLIRATPEISAIAGRPLWLRIEPDSLLDSALSHELSQIGLRFNEVEDLPEGTNQ